MNPCPIQERVSWECFTPAHSHGVTPVQHPNFQSIYDLASVEREGKMIFNSLLLMQIV